MCIRDRLKMDLWMMDCLDDPEMLISTIKEVTIENSDELMKLRCAGTNPLAELGIMPGQQAETIPTWVYIVIGILLIAIVVTIAVCAVKVRKQT